MTAMHGELYEGMQIKRRREAEASLNVQIAKRDFTRSLVPCLPGKRFERRRSSKIRVLHMFL